MSSIFRQNLLSALRDLLKERGITYAKLGRSLGLSEPSVKRLFGGRSPLTLERLEAVSEFLGISVSDLIVRAEGRHARNESFTREQEQAFAERPGLLGLFRDLYSGRAPEKVRRAWKLDAPAFFRALRRLEKLGLIDLHSDRHIAFKVRGVLRWSHTGELARRLVPEQNAPFLEHVYADLGRSTTSFLSSEVEMTRESFDELARDLQELGRKYRGIALRESQTLPKSSLLSVRWLAAAAPFRTDWTRYPL